MMTTSTGKRAALDEVRLATMALALAQPGYTGYTEAAFRAANVRLAHAQLRAADAGASGREISEASEWDGTRL